MVNCKILIDALKVGAIDNQNLKQGLEEIIESFSELQGKEGCIPVNWSGLQLFRDMLAEVDTKI